MLRRESNPLVRVTAVLGAFLMSGCYTYVPVQTVSPGEDVRVLLPVETRGFGGTTSTENIPVDGTVIAYGDSLVLETVSRQQAGNFAEMVLTDTLFLAPSDVNGVQVKQFDQTRTWGFAALIAAGTALAATAIANAGGGGDDPPGGGGNGNGASIVLGTLTGILKLFGGN